MPNFRSQSMMTTVRESLRLNGAKMNSLFLSADRSIHRVGMQWLRGLVEFAMELLEILQGKNFNYQQELDWLVTHPKRNLFIRNLVLDQKGNTLLLFQFVEKHGKILYELLKDKIASNRKIFFVHGGVNTEERELVREITERENNAIIVASYGTFSTGINIKNLHNVVFASPSKSRIRNLQSIGRVLRKGKNKVKAVLYDIADDCTHNSRKNYTLNHLIERIKIYNEENFNYEIITIQLKKK